MSESPVAGDMFLALTEVFTYLAVQSVMYIVLRYCSLCESKVDKVYSFYFDNVAPSKYGLKLPWYYPFTCAQPDDKEATYKATVVADIEPGTLIHLTLDILLFQAANTRTVKRVSVSKD